MRRVWQAAILACWACRASPSPDGPPIELPPRVETPALRDGGGAATDPGSRDAAAPPGAAKVTTSVITSSHRFVPGAMFGGWGPHLGHLLRRGAPDELWFADDACAQPCDVGVNERVDYFRRDLGGWTKVASQPLPPTVQQNTASLLAGNTIFTYGVDVAHAELVECSLGLTTAAHECHTLALTIGSSANYIGAALSPEGTKVVWLTNVQDGGGGQFRWFADYGGGWNGPRTGDVGGYNDASYIHVAFGGGARRREALLHAQLVSGLAPAWTFQGTIGALDLGTTAAATFQNALAPRKADDPIISTGDVAIDPATNDAHLFARTEKGNLVYYHRPSGGPWSAGLFELPQTFRARLIVTAHGTIELVYGPAGKGLAWRTSTARVPGQPVDWSALEEHVAALPSGYASIQAIYPEASIYQSASVDRLRVAVVGADRQNETLFVEVEP